MIAKHVRAHLGAIATVAALAALTAPAVAAAAPATVTLHASPQGTGSACRAQAPCSLVAAQQAVRRLRPALAGPAVTVRLAGGTYRPSAPLDFTAADSGAPGRPVRWEAAPGARPVISGATRVSDWSPLPGAPSTWVASVPAGSATRQLYVDGAEAPVAQRTPTQLGFAGGWVGSATGYDIASDPAAERFFGSLSAAQLQGVQFVYPGGNGAWTQSTCGVHAYAAGEITMDEPCWTDVTDRVPFSDGSGGLPSMSTSQMPGSIQNARALLSPGQWYLDPGSHRLFVDGPATMTGLDVELPRLQTLLQGAGSLADPVHDLTFSGIEFADATWNGPSSPAGFADVQSNLTMTLPGGNQGECTFSSPAGTCPWGALTQPHANVGFSGARRITLTGDRFIDLGGAGVGLEYGDVDDTIHDSRFDDIGSTAILLGCTYDPTPTVAADAAGITQHCSLDPALTAHDHVGDDEILAHTTVTDDVIEHVGTDYPSACGITLLFSRHTLIAHNDIFDVPYTAITAGVIQGHVDDQTHEQNSTNINGFNRIAGNLIHDYMQVRDDGGAMYIEGHQAQYRYNPDGTVNVPRTLAGGMHAVANVAYDKDGYSPAMYDDAGSEYIDWERNVMFELGGNAAQGGCDPSGPFGLFDNRASGPYEQYGCLPTGVSITTLTAGNQTIPDAPGPDDLPAAAIDRAGLSPSAAAALIAFPQVDYVSPPDAARAVLIGGEGFNAREPVTFSGRAATHVSVLSPGFIVATVPAGADPADAVVGTPVQAPAIVSPAPGAVNVTGTGLTVSGTDGQAATVAVSVDGATLAGCGATVHGGRWSCTVGALADGEHTLTATATLASGASATSGPTLIDVGGQPPAVLRINDTDPSIAYSAGWSYSSDRGYGDYDNDVHYTQTDGASASWTFIGTGVQVYGERYIDQGDIGVSIDGGPEQVVSTLPPGTVREADQVVFQRTDLNAGEHTIVVTKLSGTYTTLDGFAADFDG